MDGAERTLSVIIQRRCPARLLALALIALAVGSTFAPALDFAFLNWDDDAVIVRNAALDGPDVVRWAFTTTHMEHYQPASWLVWAGVKRAAGATRQRFTPRTWRLISRARCSSSP